MGKCVSKMSREFVVTIFSFKFWNKRIPSGEELSKTYLVFIFSLKMWTLDRRPFRSLCEFTAFTRFIRNVMKNYFWGM